MTKQQRVLVCGLLAVVLCGLFPPWLHTYYSTGTSDFAGSRSERSAGYNFIFAPPPPRSGSVCYGVRLDVTTLLVEWLCVGALTGVAWLVVGTAKRPESKNAGGSHLPDRTEK